MARAHRAGTEPAGRLAPIRSHDGWVDTRAKYEHLDRERLIAHCVAMDEALARVRELCELLRGEAVDGGVTDIDTLWPSDVLDAIAGR